MRLHLKEDTAYEVLSVALEFFDSGNRPVVRGVEGKEEGNNERKMLVQKPRTPSVVWK